MSEKTTPRQVKVKASLKDKFNDLPISASAAIKQAILDAHDNPILLVKALQLRMMSTRVEEAEVRMGYWVVPEIEKHCSRLSGMTELPIEQVVRLAMEAYINKL